MSVNLKKTAEKIWLEMWSADKHCLACVYSFILYGVAFVGCFFSGKIESVNR